MEKTIPTNVPGTPVVVTGPSGVGKGTVINELRKLCPDLILSISMTTRPPRPDEVEGRDYFFVQQEVFEQALEEGELIEWAEVYGHFYGTPKAFLESNFQQGNDVVLDVDLQGAAAVRSWYKHGIFIYLLPPSWGDLTCRLESRRKGAGDNIELRIEKGKSEVRFIGMFEYCVVNRDIERAANDILSIVHANRLRYDRNQAAIQSILPISS